LIKGRDLRKTGKYKIYKERYQQPSSWHRDP
jgi:hypothetical protein